MKPMLLYQKNPDLSQLKYPIYVVPKLDGIRCITDEGRVLSRSLKPIPNNQIYKELTCVSHGLDGELILGSPIADDVFNKTTSFVRSSDKESDHWHFYVFDYWDLEKPYFERQKYLWELFQKNPNPRLILVETAMAENEEDVLSLEQKYVEQGYEGAILRNPHGIYKYGRTTEKENNAYKLKRFTDSEAIVRAVIPEYHNSNELKRGATGKIERSTSADGLIAKESMGALVVYDPTIDAEFNIGTGFTAEQRKWWWQYRDELSDGNTEVVYKSFPVGAKEKPRHPVFKGIRMKGDK